MKAIRIAHLSDSHINHDGKEAFVNPEAASNFELVVDYLSNMLGDIHAVVMTGDIVHDGDANDYRYLKQIVERSQKKLGASFIFALGNHEGDTRACFFENYSGVSFSMALYVPPYPVAIFFILFAIVIFEKNFFPNYLPVNHYDYEQ